MFFGERFGTIIKVLLILNILFLFFCKKDSNSPEENNGYSYRIPEQVNDGWNTGSLQEVDMEISPLVNLMDNLLNMEANYIHSILIVKDGKLVFEEYFSGDDVDFSITTLETGLALVYKNFNRTTLHSQASVSKSFVSTLIGIAIDKGFINGIDEKLFSFFPEYADLNTG